MGIYVSSSVSEQGRTFVGLRNWTKLLTWLGKKTLVLGLCLFQYLKYTDGNICSSRVSEKGWPYVG